MRNKFKLDNNCCCGGISNPSTCYSPNCYYFNDGSNSLSINQVYSPSNGSYNTDITTDQNEGFYAPSHKIILEKVSGGAGNIMTLIQLIGNVGVDELDCYIPQSINLCMDVKNENSAYYVRFVPYILQNGTLYFSSMSNHNGVSWSSINGGGGVASTFNKLTFNSTNGSWIIDNTKHPDFYQNFSFGILAFSAFSIPNAIATAWIDNICVTFSYNNRHPVIKTHNAKVTLGTFLLNTTASSHPVVECRLTNSTLSDIAGGITGDWLVGGLSAGWGERGVELWRYCTNGICDETKINLGSCTLWLDIQVAYHLPSSGADLITVTVRFYIRPTGCRETNIPPYTIGHADYIYYGKRSDVTCIDGVFYGTVTLYSPATSISSPWSVLTGVTQPNTINIVWEKL